MARSTCNPNAEVPKGMMKFEVIRSTIRDSLGQYCGPGDMAVLTKGAAKGYLAGNWIKVAMPDFDDEEDEETDADTGPTPAADESDTEPQPSAAGSGSAERAASPRTSRKARKPSKSGASTDG